MDLAPEELRDIVLRLRRAHGHLGSVIRMIEDGADCEQVLTQLAAVDKAMSRSSYAIVVRAMQQCMSAGDVDGVDLKKMEKLFLSLA